jgi:GTP-binding protein HflX
MMELTAVLQPRMDRHGEAPALRPVEAEFEEAQSLVKAINLEVRHAEITNVREINPATLFGKGTVERLKETFADEKIKLVFVNTSLTPVQQRMLEKEWNAKVIDRKGLILEIFSARAKTSEGKLQVELAALMYQKTRLVRAWTHLERQRGGLGKTGGPGEMQKELDRRKIEDKIKTVKRDLEKVVLNRSVQRAARDKVPFPIIALVGYTNAGKSTLFNTLTNEQVFAKDLLFATLDTTLRAVKLPSGRTIILSDTVGFISQLPTDMVAAFRATLEETIHADIILHVRDIAAEYTEAERQDVLDTLGRMNLDDGTLVWEVWNKIDLLDVDNRKSLEESQKRQPGRAILTSAITGEGMTDLLAQIDDALSARDVIMPIILKPDDGETLAWLYRHATVLQREDTEVGMNLLVRISPEKLGKFQSLAAKTET